MEDQIPDVYGWLEMGGATSEESMLLNTTSVDILLRTVYPGSMIALGNTNNNTNNSTNEENEENKKKETIEPVPAALYIKNNKVGINQVPVSDSNVNLTINGDIVTNGQFKWFTEEKEGDSDKTDIERIQLTNEIHIDASNILFKSQRPQFDTDQNLILGEQTTNMRLNTLGLIENKLILTESIHLDENDQRVIFVREFTPNDLSDLVNAGYNLQVKYEPILIPRLTQNTIFIVQGVKFRILNDAKLLGTSEDDQQNLSMDVLPVFVEENFQDLPLQRNQEFTFTFYRALQPPEPSSLSNIIQSELISRVTNVSSFDLSEDKKTMTLEIALATFDNQNDPFEGKYVSQKEEFFQSGFFYYFQNKELERQEEKQTLDKIVKCTMAKPIVRPGNIKRMEVTFTGVDNVRVDGFFRTMIEAFDISNAEVNQLHFYLLDTPFRFGFDTPQPILLEIKEGQNVTSDTTVNYTLFSEDNAFLFNYLLNQEYRADYINDALYIMEPAPDLTAIWTIENFEIDNLQSGVIELKTFDYTIDNEKTEKLNQGRIANVILFRLKVINRIGDFFHDTFVPYGTRMGIATTNCPEVLTVNGTTSVRDHFIMYNRESEKPFQLSFSQSHARLQIDDQEDALTLDTDFNPANFSNVRFVDFHIQSKNKDKEEEKEEDVLFNAETRFIRPATFSLVENYPDDKKKDYPSPSVQITGKGIKTYGYGEVATEIDALGALKTKALDVQDVQTHIQNFNQMEVFGISHNTVFFDMMHHEVEGIVLRMGTALQTLLKPYDMIKIKGSMFRILKMQPDSESDFRYVDIYAEWYFKQEQDVYSSSYPLVEVGEKIDITVYRDADVKKNMRASIYFEVSSFDFEEDALGKNIFLTLSGKAPTIEKMFLSIGRFYCLKKEGNRVGIVKDKHEYVNEIPHVVILKSLSHIGRDSFVLEFRAVDNVTDLKFETDLGDILNAKVTEKTSRIFIYPLNSFFQPSRRQFPFDQYEKAKFPYAKIIENGINLSFSAETEDKMFINLEHAENLKEFVSPHSPFMINPIDRIVTERGVYDVAGVYQYDKFIKVWAKFVNTNYLKTANDTTISYAFTGIPLKVVRVDYPPDDISIVFYIKDLDEATFELLKLYIGHSVFMMDKYNRIWGVTDVFKMDVMVEATGDKEERIILTVTDTRQNPIILTSKDRVDMAQERYIYVVPLQYFHHYKMADPQTEYENFIPQRLGVGTPFIREMLTVEGSASCKKEFVLYDDRSYKPFVISYDDDVLKFNDMMHFTTSNVTIKSDIDIEGTFSADSYMTTSDERLKTNIRECIPEEDLSVLEKISVHTFELKNKDMQKDKNNNIQKGVIAQEIEQILPHVVSLRYGLIPNIQKKGYVVMDEHNKTVIRIKGQTNEDSDESMDDESMDPEFEEIVKVLRVGIQLSLKFENKDRRDSHREAKETKEIKTRLVDYNMRYMRHQKRHILSLYVDEPLELFRHVFVVGMYDHHKVVDYNYLFMTTLNALRALQTEVQALKEKA